MTHGPPENDDEWPNSRPIQPHKEPDHFSGDADVALRSSLDRDEDPETARRLERLADQDLLLTLQLNEFDEQSPEYQEFAKALAEYGYQVFIGWFVTGAVYRMAANHGGGRGVYGYRRIPEALQLDRDDAAGLAADLVMVSIARFREYTLMNPDPAKRWSPTGGASIKTFFIGRCLMELPDAYEKWVRTERPDSEVVISDYQQVAARSMIPPETQPESRNVTAMVVDEVLSDADDITKEMFQLAALDYTYEEIAEILTGSSGETVTHGMVRTKLYRYKQAARMR